MLTSAINVNWPKTNIENNSFFNTAQLNHQFTPYLGHVAAKTRPHLKQTVESGSDISASSTLRKGVITTRQR